MTIKWDFSSQKGEEGEGHVCACGGGKCGDKVEVP